MSGDTHIRTGALAALSLMISLDLKDPLVMGALLFSAAAGSLIPDIDHPSSMISRAGAVSRAVSRGACMVSAHRHFCHSLFFCMLVFLGSYLVFSKLMPALSLMLENGFATAALAGKARGLSWYLALGTFTGAMSHLAADMLNPGGVQFFWPYEKKISAASIPTGSNGERIFSAFIAAGCIAAAVFLMMRGQLRLIGI